MNHDNHFRPPSEAGPAKDEGNVHASLLHGFIRFYVIGVTISFAWLILNGWLRLHGESAYFNRLFAAAAFAAFGVSTVFALGSIRRFRWPILVIVFPMTYWCLYGSYLIRSLK